MESAIEKIFVIAFIASLALLFAAGTCGANNPIEPAKVLIEQDRLEEADELLVAAIPIAEKDSTDGQDFLADIYVLRARIATSLGKHNDARPLYEHSLAIKNKHWGTDHPECVPPMTGIATIELITGDFIEAEQIFTHGLEILAPRLNPSHPWIVEAAIGLAVCQGYRGDYAAAENTLRPHLDATIAKDGEKNGRAIQLTLELAEVLAMLGKDVESTLLYRSAYSNAEEIYGLNHTTTAKTLAGLAHTYRRLGKGLEARALYKQCIEIVESRHGTPHPDIVRYRCRLGMSLFEGDRWSTEALASIERGISEGVELYGRDSYQVALEERQLGLVLMGQHRWQEAADVFASCIPILERYFGPTHPFLSKSLKGIAWSLLHLNQPDDALYYSERAVSLHEASAEHDALELTYVLNMKAIIEVDAHAYDAAVISSKRAVELAIGVQEENLKISSTREAVLYAVRPWSSAQVLVTAAAAHPRLSDAEWGDVFSLVVRTHGSVLDWQAERHLYLGSVGDTTGADEPNAAVENAAQRLAGLVVNGPDSDTTAYYEELARARRTVEETERALSATTEEWRTTSDFVTIHHDISRESLADALDRGAILAHFLTYSKIVDSPSNTPSWRVPHYAVFCLSKIDSDAHELDFVDLGPMTSLDSLIAGYRTAIDGIRSPQKPSTREEADYRRFARAIYDRIWAPLFPDSLSESSRHGQNADAPLVLIVPDAGLHRVDFNTLLSPAGELVIENWKTHLLSSGADLLRTHTDHGFGHDMLAAGNPNHTGNGSLILEEDGSTTTRPNRIFCVDASILSTPLPGAEVEANNVAGLFAKETGESTTVLTGVYATETRVKQEMTAKRIVHLATHGFVCDESETRSRSLEEDLIDPLLMSGLVFAPVPGEDDGLLTAQEVTCLDLRSVEWVVLSACGSGLGKVVWGEGMFGLRRAFEIAGARTVVMALWRLDDAGTRRLMEEIYKRKLAGASTVDAIRDSQLDRITDIRRRLNRIHPALWGGIVAEGDWR